MSEVISTRPVGVVRLYACGGGGINIGKEYQTDGHSADIAKFETVFIDTSDSNMENGMEDNAWLFKGMDGSGKIRQANAVEIIKQVPDIIRKFPARDLNIVVFTASGGTGSVAGPAIMKALLEDGKMVVGIVTASHENDRHTNNTFGALKTMDKYARDLDCPFVIQYNTNAPDGPRTNVDKEAHLMINALAMLGSRRNHGLDSADLMSLFHFNKSTSVPACMSRIYVFDDIAEFEDSMTDPIAAAYLKRDVDDPQPQTHVPYSCDGFMPKIAQTGTSLFFGIENSSFAPIIKDLQQKVDEIEKRKKTRADAVLFFSDDDQADSKTDVIY